MTNSDLVPIANAPSVARLQIRRILGPAMMALITSCQPAFPQQSSRPAAAETCLAANQKLSLGISLPRVAARLNSGQPLTIVTLGSSSTVGLWVFNSAATYPEV